ncbi:MAG: hypothetical protein H6738_20855 [Alphaproteobacteria bacterium]|nr:hypothetical protein [Alphaproteobacteria bacterium]MCB9699243.1 hypothetical protein [Alphaproteobacteria bacterium]
MRVAPLALLSLVACSSKLAEVPAGTRRHLYGAVESSAKGTARVKVPVDPLDSSLLVTAQVPAPWAVHVRSLRSPDGTEVFRAFEWNSSPYNKTNGGFVSTAATLNWPVSSSDPILTPGKWEIEFGVVDAAQQYTKQQVAVDVLLKKDLSYSEGALDVAIVYTGGVQEDPGLRDAVEEAKGIWTQMYASFGVDVRFSKDMGYPTDIGPPALGDEEAYELIAAQTGIPHVNLVISNEIVGFEQIFGIAGDIPGPLVPTTRSGVQVSAVLAAGPDGRYSDEDVRLLAETMAHETAHFLGLFHPVESSWDAWDVLNDTSECDNETVCKAELGENLMFPFPVCSVVSCVPQNEITLEQAEVVHRYTGVD